MVGSARLIRGGEDCGFEFPCQKGHRFTLPEVVRDTPPAQRAEVGRLVSEMPHGFGMVRLLTTLGLLQAMAWYHEKAGLICGVATIKRRLLRGLTSMGLPLHHIPSEGAIYPRDRPLAPYFHQHPDPVAPAYWLVAEMIPSVRRVIARYRRGAAASPVVKVGPTSRGSWRSSGGLGTGRSYPERHRTRKGGH